MAGSNNKTRKVSTNTVIADVQALLTPSTNYNEGDFIIISSNVLATPASETDGATLLGVAPTTVVNGKPASAIVTDVDASQGIPATPGPEFGDEFLCTAKSGDAFTPGCAIYLAPGTTSPAGSKNGVSVSGTKIIGVYTGPSFTATGVEQIVCKIGSRYPGDTLKL